MPGRRDDEDKRHRPGPAGVEAERLGRPVQRDGVQHHELDGQGRGEREPEDPVARRVVPGQQRIVALLGGLLCLVGLARLSSSCR